MLEGLDAIPWHALTHAYGKASDVPGLIRDLASLDQKRRHAAYEKLFTNIWHQGTVFEASVHALPFLIDLLRAPDTPEPDHVALLVASIISGDGGYSKRVEHGPILNPFTRKPMKLPDDIEQRLANERTLVDEIRRRGGRAVPLLEPYLSHLNRDLRETAAAAIAAVRGGGGDG